MLLRLLPKRLMQLVPAIVKVFVGLGHHGGNLVERVSGALVVGGIQALGDERYGLDDATAATIWFKRSS